MIDIGKQESVDDAVRFVKTKLLDDESDKFQLGSAWTNCINLLFSILGGRQQRWRLDVRRST
jgi:hypothetical protein